jgi:Methyltransferase FkbM domain
MRSTAELSERVRTSISNIHSKMKSQLGQEVFALVVNEFVKGGWFVEAGATNGIHLSNTYVLEKFFDWRGILVEPAKGWHKELAVNRSSIIDNRALYRVSDQELEFLEEVPTIFASSKGENWTTMRETSGLVNNLDTAGLDSLVPDRAVQRYGVKTVSLTDLLYQSKAPSQLNYLSLDTEGSEFEILSAFDFQSYGFNCITVEHNHGVYRDAIRQLLQDNKYIYLSELADVACHDDWYVHRGAL